MSITITNKLIMEEASKLGIESEVISTEHNLVVLRKGDRKMVIRRAVTPESSAVVRYVADHKDATYDLLRFYGYQVPRTKSVMSINQAIDAGHEIGFPLVIKPEDSAYGRGVTIGITNEQQIEEAFKFAFGINQNTVLVQSYITGYDFRIMVVGYRVVAIAKRIPCRIFGDGKSTIQELIDVENKNSNRGHGHEKPMTFIEVDKIVKDYLASRDMTLQSVPSDKEEVFLRETANLSTGGESEDYTDLVPAENIKMFENMAKDMGASVIGIDIRCEDITRVLSDDYAVIEVNASPGIRMHHFPSKGKPRNVALEIVKILFPEK